MAVEHTMARKVALIPEELVSSYHLQKPELRVEDDIVQLLDRNKLPDDMKVKLLSQLVTRYHKTVHKEVEPVKVSIEPPTNTVMEEQKDDYYSDPIYNDIIASVNRLYQKYVPMIIEKLKTRGYFWNVSGELTIDGKNVENSRIVDFFVYMLRSAKTLVEPLHFDMFWKAIQEINIPHSWIANKKLLSRLNIPQEQPSSTPGGSGSYKNLPHSKLFQSPSRSSDNQTPPQEWLGSSKIQPNRSWFTY